MIDVEPEVFLVAEPQVNFADMLNYLERVGGVAWLDRVVPRTVLAHQAPAAELLTEFMGRLCYRSWEPGLNRNVTKVREDRGDYLANILRVRHGSVLAHSYFNFVIHNGSRVFTAEMNRHAVGTAISEQSLRYVRLDKNIPFRLPHDVLKRETVQLGEELVSHIERQIALMYQLEGIDDQESFFAKKTITSAIRRFAPMGMATEEGWTANVRAIRHVISMRTAQGAEEEIRFIADQIARIMCERCPLLFGDYEQLVVEGAPPEWVTPNWKV